MMNHIKQRKCVRKQNVEGVKWDLKGSRQKGREQTSDSNNKREESERE